jgi:hypothetical protein
VRILLDFAREVGPTLDRIKALVNHEPLKAPPLRTLVPCRLSLLGLLGT